MRSHVEFRSDAFPAEPGEEKKINPGRWGMALARTLRSELTARGFPGGDPFFEDWGVCVPINNEEYPLWVGCGNYDEHPNGFLCFIEPSKPVIRRWFRKIDVSAKVMAVAEALDGTLRGNPSITDIRWWEPE